MCCLSKRAMEIPLVLVFLASWIWIMQLLHELDGWPFSTEFYGVWQKVTEKNKSSRIWHLFSPVPLSHLPPPQWPRIQWVTPPSSTTIEPQWNSRCGIWIHRSWAHLVRWICGSWFYASYLYSQGTAVDRCAVIVVGEVILGDVIWTILLLCKLMNQEWSYFTLN